MRISDWSSDVCSSDLPEDGLIGIGSGGSFALAAARALVEVDGLDAEAIARKAMKIAGDICIYTNENITIETLPSSSGARHGRSSASRQRRETNHLLHAALPPPRATPTPQPYNNTK